MKELRIYNIPDDTYEKMEEKAKELNMTVSEYAKTLMVQSLEDYTKLIKKLVEKYNKIDIQKLANLELMTARFKSLLNHYKTEHAKILAEIETLSYQRDTLIAMSKFDDLMTMMQSYLTNVDSSEYLKQIQDEIKALKETLDELAILQGLKVKKVVKI